MPQKNHLSSFEWNEALQEMQKNESGSKPEKMSPLQSWTADVVAGNTTMSLVDWLETEKGEAAIKEWLS